MSNKILRGSLIRISLNLYVDQLVEWEDFHFLGNVVIRMACFMLSSCP